MAQEAEEHQTKVRRWYTVQEAAEYLGVSQPTIFRWMKDGQLSFYKIGGSTRFVREGLDAVIEKTTGSKEAEGAAGCLNRVHPVGLEADGVGIAADNQAMIFEPFYSTKGVEGNGLGLAAVRNIIERHGGAITLDSTPGLGSNFKIYLPSHEDDVNPTQGFRP